MRKYFDRLKMILLDFIEQRDNLQLLVACPPGEAALMLKLLLDHQNSSKDDLFFLFPDEFTTASDYVSRICARLQREYSASLESDPLPTPPVETLADSQAPAVDRLVACLTYGRQLVPLSTGHRVVWCFSPEIIHDMEGYLSLWKLCSPATTIEAWMRGTRMIVRVPEGANAEAALSASKRVEIQKFVIPDNANEMELRETIANLKLPQATRQQAQLQIAFIDMAHGRTAVAKTALLSTLAFHQQRKDPALQSLAMIGLGDACRRENNIDKAKYWYECAIRPAGEGRQTMCLAMIAQHLGSIAFERQQYEDATFYYDQLTLLKRAIPDENGLVDALLWRASSELQQHHQQAALTSCQESLLLCKSFNLEHREEECLTALKRTLIAAGQPVEAELASQEWQAVEALGAT